MKTSRKEPLILNARLEAWVIVMNRTEEQLLFLPAHMSNRAAELRRFISLANKARSMESRSTIGITIEKEEGHEYVVVWVSQLGGDRLVASIVLPISVLWRVASAKYLDTFNTVPDERQRIIEEDEWLS